MEKIDQKLKFVSICIPCYNAAIYISKTLECLLKQTHKALEIVIIDDHSVDESLKTIKDYSALDKRITYEIADGNGASAARNQAYNLSKGDFFIFFDADDWVPVNFIETQLQALKTDTEVVVSNWGRFYQNNLTTIEIDPFQVKRDLTFKEWITNYWLNNSNMTCPGRILVPRNLIEQSGLWDEHLNLNDDFTFYTRIFSNSTFIRYNNDSLFYYRSGINGLSSKKGPKAFLSQYQSLLIAIKVAESKLETCEKLNSCYANLLQSFVYEIYPQESHLVKESKKLIKLYGGSDLKHPAGGRTKSLNLFLGWKLVAIFKNILRIK